MLCALTGFVFTLFGILFLLFGLKR